MGGIFPRHRQLDGDQQFVRRQRGLIDTPEEILGRNSPLACLAACDNDRAEREHAGWQFRCRIGVSQAAANRSPIADRGMCDMCNRRRQQGRMRGDFRRFQQVGVACQRTDRKDPAFQRNSTQFADLADVDDQLG